MLYDPPRRTELFIVLTMYNEDEVLFCRTMHGVMSTSRPRQVQLTTGRECAASRFQDSIQDVGRGGMEEGCVTFLITQV